MFKDIYPFKSHFLDLNGHKLHYVDEGSGEPVVMLHGNPTWSFYYRNLIKALSPKFRVIAPDHIGCGLSDKPGVNDYSYTLKQRIEDVESLLTHTGTDSNITLVVHDWGGMIGMSYAARHISAIKRIVVLNTAAFHLPSGKAFPWMLSVCQNPIVGPFMVRGLNAFCRSALRYCPKKPLGALESKAYMDPYNSWQNRIAVLRFVQDIPLKPDHESYDIVTTTQNTLPDLQSIPMMICWGKKDFIFDVDFYNEWLRRFPKAETHMFHEAGHYVLEDAKDEIITLVSNFMES